MFHSAGKKFHELVKNSLSLQVHGTINAYSAMLAESVGCQAMFRKSFERERKAG
jgi:methylisocitrate lyase